MDKLLYYNSCVKNLSILRDADLASLHLDYVCPLCMKSFPSEVAKTELTEEDVPQKSLGGHRITLTCKQCNSKCGSIIDIHLMETMTTSYLKTPLLTFKMLRSNMMFEDSQQQYSKTLI